MGDTSIKLKVFEGIPIKKAAKYLGLNYNHTINPAHSIKSIMPKINYIRFRLSRVLRKSDFRTKYNCWQVFVCPLLNMLTSLCGHPNSARALEVIKSIQTYMRATLKQFLMVNKNSPNFIFNELIYSQDRIMQNLINLDKKVETHTGIKWPVRH